MIEIEVKDGLYLVRGPKFTLALTKSEFITALKRAKRYKRWESPAARLAPQPQSREGA
jgi:hypothetical protein